MGDPAGQLADRLHLLRLEQGLLRPFQGLLGLVLVGDVAGDLGEADQFALLVADGVDHHVGPETLAVAPHAPTLALETPVHRRLLQVAGRDAGGAVLFGVEAREVLTQDVVGLVALEALGPGVPARHVAGGVQHIDGVVVDRVDQHAVARVVVPSVVDAHRLIHPPPRTETPGNARIDRRVPVSSPVMPDHGRPPGSRAGLGRYLQPGVVGG